MLFDIYKVLPNKHGSLDHILIAGNYDQWEHVILALAILREILIKIGDGELNFQVQVCTHRVNSSHYKTYISHTAPTTEEELKDLLQNV